MSELSNYSIESDHIVVLAFKDGRRLRVPVGQLPNHLGALDLEKIRSAIKLRREFIRRHMPKVVLLVLAGGLIALLAVGRGPIAQLFAPQHAPVLPNQSEIVRNELAPTPAAATPVAASVEPASTSRVARKVATRHVVKTVSALAVVPAPDATPSPTPAPAPTPDPSPSPSPSVSPNPPASDSDGKVAGCSSTPTDPTPDCSMMP